MDAQTKRLDYITSQACNSRRLAGSWVHLAGTYDGAVMRLFVNGVLAIEGFTQTGPIRFFRTLLGVYFGPFLCALLPLRTQDKSWSAPPFPPPASISRRPLAQGNRACRAKLT